ncbi:MAG: DUF2344 domain-containing protein [Clostridia bacterium]|nr:DUF2344 domain-containing protein [Clostridia bacterium]
MVPTQEITKVRIKFSKVGDLMYISHLDLARTMQRIILRSELDIWYSEGFNPQPKMVFAQPLPTGVESVCELLDIKLNSYMDCEEIKERLNRNFPREMRVLDVYTPEEKIKEIAFTEYKISLYSDKIGENTQEDVEKLFTGECLLEKKTKSGVKEINVSDYIKEISAKADGNELTLIVILHSSAEKTLSPEILVEAMRKYLGIMTSDGIDEHYSIMRERMLKSDLSEFR